ncbi:hypothetical protein A9Z42_0050770 [Trichoderma parareesei]|uniref:Amidase domain-containing protein n=1 Tax=Trichoderma parareesei TaxID=858221 RepID=A0A2H2ZMS2_TRIPA|nr:hypothetical protein A9Z42_0050770 [Trichoderma parareesei]
MFEEAITRAKWLDAEYKKRGKPVGPLHGLPISVKDQFFIKGSTSQAVQMLLNAGCVIVAKTTVSPDRLDR